MGYGTLPNGTEVQRISISSGAMKCDVLTLGATIASLEVPDTAGATADVVLGFDSFDGWAADTNPFFNVCVGRVSGRTAAPGFTLDGSAFTLAGNDGGGGGIKSETNLHGGVVSFAKRVWSVGATSADSVTMTLAAADGEEGFPGALEVSVTYSLVNGSELHLCYDVTTSKPSPISLTNHAYFNLRGAVGGTPTVNDAEGGHSLQLNSSAYNPDDGSGDGVPTGERRSVVGTVRDYRLPTPMAQVIAGQAADTPIWPHGEQFVVDGAAGRDPNDLARLGRQSTEYLPVVGVLAEAGSGRVLTVLSSEPIVQTYYSTLLGGTHPGKGGAKHELYGAVCLESHRPANAENVTAVEGYGSRIATPDTPYAQTTVWRFSTIK